MKYFVLILICAAINSLDESNKAYRKLYGLSFHENCGNYLITFKCMTACKSMGFQVFRLDSTCKCTCHEVKTTTILPAFVWRTNGTTKKVPPTFSPKLYAIVGTMSPATENTDVHEMTLHTSETTLTGGTNVTDTATTSSDATEKQTDSTKPVSVSDSATTVAATGETETASP